MKAFTATLLLTLLLILSGCSSAPSQPTEPQAVPATNPLSTGELKTVQQQWQGVPYRLGGSSKKGIDCSGFVAVTYQQLLAMSLPRTVEEQAELGYAVTRAQLRSGDLLFFKTGRVRRHVGIYLSNGEFMHASTSQGVTISSLNNDYWRRHYWQARRLQP
ncbi:MULTISPECIES: NlpC/P60 family protein [Shewanella]|jgi:cell wall-associated NlpC family hydrolase|uniref:NlpC/P60 family protein n=1 Tax=Shewanella TaxID=22 RepID=UPI001672CABB|nr:NlpC/P60 family protein [Shewanella fodinae]MCL2906215.1 NlpC/P60 family protein [Shewanella fodinae]GGY99241.1 peptidase P60 [Shewanella fodinae]